MYPHSSLLSPRFHFFFNFSSFELNSNIEWLFFCHHFAFFKSEIYLIKLFFLKGRFSVLEKKCSVCLFLNLYWRDQTQGPVAHPARAFTVRCLQGLSFLWNLTHLFLKALGLGIKLGGAAQRELVLYSGDYLMKREHSSFLKGLFMFLLLVMKLTLFFEKIQQRRTRLILPGSSEKEILFLQLHRQHQWDNVRYFQILCLYYYI